ncbi:MAG: shikimate dehydrogenase [Elusimicrobia bacterium]|nr:shikimate dehydrogenase [Candidatus Obscuribacterium magneticum]
MVYRSLHKQFERARPGDVGIIGDPIAHTLSPVMQNAAFKVWRQSLMSRRGASPRYHAFRVIPEQLDEALALARRFKLRGLNVTIPHKVSACRVVDHLHPFAKRVGAINTITFGPTGAQGFNTDGVGFQAALRNDLGFDAAGKTALVLGAGGTGRVIVEKLLELKAGKIYWWNRSMERDRGPWEEESGVIIPLAGSIDRDIPKALKEADLVVNATSVGLSAGDGLPHPELKFYFGQAVFDVIYHRDTVFMKTAKAAGARVCGGLGMLLYQGVESFRLWTGTDAPVEVMRHALQEALSRD